MIYAKADLMNDILLMQYDIRQSRMIYLLRKCDIFAMQILKFYPFLIRVAYITLYGYALGESIKDIISKIYHPFCEERI